MRGGQLRRYVAEEASETELRAIRAHLLHCRACGLEVARMRGHLHEVATGLAALFADGTGRRTVTSPATFRLGYWRSPVTAGKRWRGRREPSANACASR
jgi:Putative zinc-finger